VEREQDEEGRRRAVGRDDSGGILRAGRIGGPRLSARTEREPAARLQAWRLLGLTRDTADRFQPRVSRGHLALVPVVPSSPSIPDHHQEQDNEARQRDSTADNRHVRHRAIGAKRTPRLAGAFLADVIRLGWRPLPPSANRHPSRFPSPSVEDAPLSRDLRGPGRSSLTRGRSAVFRTPKTVLPQILPSSSPQSGRFQRPLSRCVGPFAGVQEPASEQPRYAAFFVACLPVPLHAGHPATMDSAYTGAGT
jgi:hypothetical protein